MFFVWLQLVIAKAEAGVQKNLIVLISLIKVLDQPQQAGPIKPGQAFFEVSPCRFGFWFFRYQFHEVQVTIFPGVMVP
ncbi:MAG: hypothetical protein RRA15_07545 [bacterium]|nr:hypothetical protein [bacterium]